MRPPRLPRLVSALLLSLFFGAAAEAQTPPIRIMPLGDSITDGSAFDAPDGVGGYRGKLFSLLTAAGYNVDSIGSLTINSGQLPIAEREHEGHSGWRIRQLRDGMAGWLANMADPDVVLMHIGTNDFGGNDDINNAINRLDDLILHIATLRPFAHIIVSNLMERGEPHNTNIQTLFNPDVQTRVNAHAAAGRRVTFLDMRAACPIADMPDQLHPSQAGYDKMAAAWLPAIQAVISPEGDAAPPQIVRARGATNRTSVTVTFSKPVADSAAAVGNFTLSGGLAVTDASLDATKRVVTLTTNQQALGTTYTVTVSGVQDRIATPNTIAANSTATFSAAIPRGYSNHVPEAAGYTLAYSLDVPAVANYATLQPAYSVNNRIGIGPFSRVAYYVELQTETGDLQYLWASMDAFTNDVNKIAVPTAATGAIFQQSVENLNVISNVAGVVNGTELAGNIEFWPTNYSAPNGAGVAGASDSLYDFGDTRAPGGTYGSMQLHNAGAAQTLFAFNNWGGSATTGSAEIGLGNNPSGNPDYTFTPTAGGYTVKTIQVLVQTTGDFAGPTFASAQATFGRSQIVASFSEPIVAGSVRPENFSVSHGVIVLGASLAANQRDVILTTTGHPVSTVLTLTASGVRDTSPNANRSPAGTSVAVAESALPPEILSNVGAAANGYHLVASLNVPVTGNLNAAANPYALDDRAAAGTFNRVAYYLELQKPGGPVEFVWVAMDPFTVNRGKLGVPTLASGAVFQRTVSNMDVISNVAGVTNGVGIATGNIEFWPTDYSAPNGASVPNASATAYDFGDTRSTAGGHGSMQVHNHGAGQTLFAINNFGVDGNPLAIGIGNQPNTAVNVDWTFAANAGTYSRRVLHVLVLPGATTDPAIITKVPEAAHYQLVYSLNLPTAGNLVSGAGFTNYSVNNSADVSGFSRVAYYVELQKTGESTPSYVWTSLDAPTTNVAQIGVPTPASGAVFQGPVSNLNVASNVAGVVNGAGIATGNIEFWPTNYTQTVPAGVLPGDPGSTAVFDFNDTRSTTGSHGSMQIHNYGAVQTLFAINNWGGAANSTNVLGIGIGNNPNGAQAPDYTLSGNAASYDLKRVLHVFVLPGNGDLAGPALTGAKGSVTLNRLVVSFSEPVADSAAAAANFSIDGGLTVIGATLLAGNRDVALTTSAQTPGTVYAVTAANIRDRSAAGNLIAAGAATTFTAYTPPPVLANVPETSDFKLVYRLAIPSASPRWNVNPIPYSVDEARYGEQPFDRVAYLLELDGNWAYASFDPFTTSIGKVGVPTPGVTATAFQQKVTRMNVASNVPGIATGTDIATGNIEFWGGNYGVANALAIPNASATTIDFGDTMAAGGHACMQIHNHDIDGAGAGVTGQTVLAYNNWGSNAGQTSDTGIGTNPSATGTGTGQQPDWTFSNSASAYTTRNLYVLVRPAPATGPGPQLLSQPISRTVNQGGTTTLAVMANGAGPFTYQWRRNGVAIAGATNSWLELTGIGAEQAGAYVVVVTSANGASTTSQAATVSLSNQSPLFTGFRFTAGPGETALLPLASLLTKATDADGDTLSISAVSPASQGGGAVAFAVGAVQYTPAAAFFGADSFTVTIADGRGGSVVGTVNATVTSAAIQPTGGATVARRVDGKLDVLFRGTPGQSYDVKRSIDLVNWMTIQTLTPGDDGLLPLTDATPPADQAFYRIQLAQ